VRRTLILRDICGYDATRVLRQAMEGFPVVDPITLRFEPKFDGNGLVSAVVVDAITKDVLMVAFMDAEALAATRATGFAHFHSRSRARLWKKGESSGNVLAVERVLVDCDQDALVVECTPAGPTCHTGADSCFFRLLDGDALRPVNT
jgi:phosphoribosyl-AMP cyclohydrolase